MKVLFKDNHSIAVVKPHGMLTQGDKTGDPSLFDEVKKYLKEKGNKKGEAFLGLVHRLDRPVGGVVIFAKTSKGAARLSEQFRAHKVVKIYWAVVEGIPNESDGDVVAWLKKDERMNTVRLYKKETDGALRAELHYRVLKTRGDKSLVEITPKTGRPHQIRVAMQSLGCPIVGDLKYGSKTALGSAIALFARSLSFKSAVGERPITVVAEPELSIFTIDSLS